MRLVATKFFEFSGLLFGFNALSDQFQVELVRKINNHLNQGQVFSIFADMFDKAAVNLQAGQRTGRDAENGPNGPGDCDGQRDRRRDLQQVSSASDAEDRIAVRRGV